MLKADDPSAKSAEEKEDRTDRSWGRFAFVSSGSANFPHSYWRMCATKE
jgi:hypothetical protein